ncbi:glycosyl hydrolase family 28 protein [Flavobacterium sp. ARAG 55.4]|uniref:glycosyl hydrolase family 28 protein n=1 Tax=Flavobacterium sp. ARAG 55.4 TaxID=3451357 RepID=UPI003F4585CC
MSRNINTIIVFLCGFLSHAQLITYDSSLSKTAKNEFVFSSPYYKISLIQNDLKKDCFVYGMNAMHVTNNSKSTSWSNFSFEGKVKVRVSILYKKIKFAQVLPRKATINVTIIDNHTIEFEISKPGQYSIEFEQGTFIEHPLLLFANPLEVTIPNKLDKNVIYFEPGYHEIGDKFIIPSNTTVYIAGGAYVKGQFFAENAENITIKGRGILSGEDYNPRTHNHMITIRDSKEIKIEGITIIHASRYMISLSGSNHHLDNVKMMGWWFSTDGVSSGENSLIENCFFKVNDDAIKLYNSNTIVKKCVIWQLENGAPFMISWNGSRDFGNVKVQDVDVIRVEHHWDNENLAVFCAVHGSKAHISNFEIEDIRIDNSNWRMFHIVTRPNRWANWNPSKGCISDFTFKNIDYYGQQKIPSLLMGHDINHPVFNFTFENLKINGQKVLNAKEFLIIDESTTSSIVIQ